MQKEIEDLIYECQEFRGSISPCYELDLGRIEAKLSFLLDLLGAIGDFDDLLWGKYPMDIVERIGEVMERETESQKSSSPG